jgi:hypothetical protein
MRTKFLVAVALTIVAGAWGGYVANASPGPNYVICRTCVYKIEGPSDPGYWACKGGQPPLFTHESCFIDETGCYNIGTCP